MEVVRFGMNKKSLDPVNDSAPFYHNKNGAYTPTGNMFVTNYSRSFYKPKAPGQKKIVWMETIGDVQPLLETPTRNITAQIRIDKNKIIEEAPRPCLINNSIHCNEFEINGPCAVIYDTSSTPSVYIIALGEVFILD